MTMMVNGRSNLRLGRLFTKRVGVIRRVMLVVDVSAWSVRFVVLGLLVIR